MVSVLLQVFRHNIINNRRNINSLDSSIISSRANISRPRNNIRMCHNSNITNSQRLCSMSINTEILFNSLHNSNNSNIISRKLTLSQADITTAVMEDIHSKFCIQEISRTKKITLQNIWMFRLTRAR